MELIVVELIGTKLPFLSLNDSSGPVDVDKLLKVLPIEHDPFPDAPSEDRAPTRLERLKEELCAVVIMPAQSEESGRRSATIVSASVPASGKSFTVTYSRTAKMASQVSGDRGEGGRKTPTGNDHRATTHDHENLHGGQVFPAHSLAGHNSPEELPSEYQGEKPDRDGLSCQGACGNPLLAVICAVRHNCHRVSDAFCKTKADCVQENPASKETDGVVVLSLHDFADGMSLKDERHVDRDCHEKRDDSTCDTRGHVTSADAADIVAEEGIEFRPRTGEEESEEKSAKGAKNEGEAVEHVDRLVTLRLSSEEGRDEEHDQARAELRAIVNTGSDGVEEPLVDVRHRNRD
jgi:hypothetical protein